MRYRTPNLKKPEQILVPLFRLPSHKLFYKQSFVKQVAKNKSERFLTQRFEVLITPLSPL